MRKRLFKTLQTKGKKSNLFTTSSSSCGHEACSSARSRGNGKAKVSRSSALGDVLLALNTSSAAMHRGRIVQAF